LIADVRKGFKLGSLGIAWNFKKKETQGGKQESTNPRISHQLQSLKPFPSSANILPPPSPIHHQAWLPCSIHFRLLAIAMGWTCLTVPEFPFPSSLEALWGIEIVMAVATGGNILVEVVIITHDLVREVVIRDVVV
jgi:hypothetical protein